MSRLFITSREIHLINDLTKEYIKDVVGQFIYYYPISILKTQVHPIYDEATEKIFENPIKLDVVASQPDRALQINTWSMENTTTMEVMIQARDLIDKQIEPTVGDMFLYGDEVFEITNVSDVGDIFGQAEYNIYYKLSANLVRSGRFDLETFQKLLQDRKDFQQSSVQKVFEQQRGLSEIDTDGATGDVRQVRERLKDDMTSPALGEGPRQVNSQDEEDISDTTNDPAATSFYNE